MAHEPGEARKQLESKALRLHYSPTAPPVVFLEGSDEITTRPLRAVALASGTREPGQGVLSCPSQRCEANRRSRSSSCHHQTGWRVTPLQGWHKGLETNEVCAIDEVGKFQAAEAKVIGPCHVLRVPGNYSEHSTASSR